MKKPFQDVPYTVVVSLVDACSFKEKKPGGRLERSVAPEAWENGNLQEEEHQLDRQPVLIRVTSGYSPEHKNTRGKHLALEKPTLSLSCWQSCREMVRNTSVSLSHGTTHSTLWMWLTSKRLLLSSLWKGRLRRFLNVTFITNYSFYSSRLNWSNTYNMAPGLCNTELPAGLKFFRNKTKQFCLMYKVPVLFLMQRMDGIVQTLVVLGGSTWSWYTIRHSLLRLM